MGDETQVAYGGRWWRKEEDGLILVRDEDTSLWDVWEGDLDGPLPPPRFIEEEAFYTSPYFLYTSRWPKRLAGAFVVAGVAHLALQVWVAILFNPGGGFSSPDYIFELQIASQATWVLWQLLLGGLVIIGVFAVLEYTRSRRLLEGYSQWIKEDEPPPEEETKAAD